MKFLLLLPLLLSDLLFGLRVGVARVAVHSVVSVDVSVVVGALELSGDMVFWFGEVGVLNVLGFLLGCLFPRFFSLFSFYVLLWSVGEDGRFAFGRRLVVLENGLFGASFLQEKCFQFASLGALQVHEFCEVIQSAEHDVWVDDHLGDLTLPEELLSLVHQVVGRGGETSM